MNKYTHITYVQIELTIKSDETEADFINFINLIGRDGLDREV